MKCPWDGRDALLWSQIHQLGSYGLIGNDPNNPMISRKAVIELLEKNNDARYKAEEATRFGLHHRVRQQLKGRKGPKNI